MVYTQDYKTNFLCFLVRLEPWLPTLKITKHLYWNFLCFLVRLEPWLPTLKITKHLYWNFLCFLVHLEPWLPTVYSHSIDVQDCKHCVSSLIPKPCPGYEATIVLEFVNASLSFLNHCLSSWCHCHTHVSHSLPLSLPPSLPSSLPPTQSWWRQSNVSVTFSSTTSILFPHVLTWGVFVGWHSG